EPQPVRGSLTPRLGGRAEGSALQARPPRGGSDGANHGAGQTFQPNAFVHEAYLRLGGWPLSAAESPGCPNHHSTATAQRFAATATADPELDPQGLRSSTYGFLVSDRSSRWRSSCSGYWPTHSGWSCQKNGS